MKKYYIYIIGIAAALFSACENVSEEERVLEVAEVEARRTVLLEDYTGQACVNCPNAHEEAAELHEVYHENLIIVAIHAGEQAFDAPTGLKQAEGDEYADKFGIKNYPVGIVNRRGELVDYTSWGASVYKEIQIETPLELSVSAELMNGKLAVKVNMLSLKNITGKLQLWVTEDYIVGPQISHEGPKPQYVHNHVFRGAINGTWGEEVSLVSGEEIVTESNFFELNSAWNPENLSVVAFVYNNAGVLQAAQCKVTVNE